MTDQEKAALTAAIEQLGRSPGYETGPTRTPYLRGYHEALYDVLRVLDAQAGETCEWRETGDIDFNLWHSSCGEDWQFLDSGPAENNARFCHGCGKRIVAVHFTYPADED